MFSVGSVLGAKLVKSSFQAFLEFFFKVRWLRTVTLAGSGG